MKLPFGLEVMKKQDVSNIKKELFTLSNQIAELRPSLGVFGLQGQNIHLPYFPLQFIKLYHIGLYSDVLKNVTLSLKNEIFRKGIEVNPKFLSKCEDCDKEYQKEIIMCDSCGNITRSPSDDEKLLIEVWINKSNENNQSMIDVLGTVEDDINIVDDGWILLLKDYTFKDGEIIGGKLREILRLNSLYVNFISDGQGKLGYNRDGKPVYVCPVHRDVEYHTPGKCPRDNIKLYKAFYSYEAYGGGGDIGKSNSKLYYLEGEVIHASKYSPSILRGFPPVLAIWQKVMILIHQDTYLLDYYGKQRPPKGLLMVNTQNQTSLQKAWQWLLDKAQANPHIIWPLAVQSNSTRGNVGQFINFMNTLEEMQFTEARNEIRRQIGALYGVMPIFQSDTSTSGGLNNESLQITVTNRAVELGQKIYNDKFFPVILDALGVMDWEIKLIPSEERDEMAELQRDAQKITNAQSMLSMGFDVDMDDEGDFIFSGEAKVLEVQQDTELDFDTSAANSMSGAPQIFSKGYGNYEEDLIQKGRLPKVSKDRDLIESKLSKDLKKELDGLIKSLKFGNKNKKDLKSKIDSLSKKFVKDLKSKASKDLKKIYIETVDKVEKELDRNFTFGEVDENAVEAIKDSKVFSETFEGVGKETTNRLNNVISEAFKDPKKFTIGSLIKELKEQAELSEGRLALIARTETTKISNAARIISYQKADEKGDFKFKWLGPDDARTTKTCKAIKKRTINGVSMDELLKIMKEESKKDFPEFEVTKNSPIPHYACRHLIVRVI